MNEKTLEPLDGAKVTADVMEELDEKKELWELLTERAAAHKSVCEKWTHGRLAEVWKDDNGVPCGRYEDGAWWHYNDRGEWY